MVITVLVVHQGVSDVGTRVGLLPAMLTQGYFLHKQK